MPHVSNVPFEAGSDHREARDVDHDERGEARDPSLELKRGFSSGEPEGVFPSVL